MYEIKESGKVFTSKFVGTGPPSYEKRIYRFAVSQRLRNIVLGPRHYMGWGVSPTPWPPLPPGKTRYPLYRRQDRPQGRSGRAENLIPTGLRSRTVKPVAQSLYRLSYPAYISCVDDRSNSLFYHIFDTATLYQ